MKNAKFNTPRIECETVIIWARKRINPFWAGNNTFHIPFHSFSYVFIRLDFHLWFTENSAYLINFPVGREYLFQEAHVQCNNNNKRKVPTSWSTLCYNVAIIFNITVLSLHSTSFSGIKLCHPNKHEYDENQIDSK